MRIILKKILLALFISFVSFASVAHAQEQDNAAIAAMQCEELKNPLNKAKFEAIDIKSFADWYLTRMEKKYPKIDIETFKHHVLSYEPVEGKRGDANPFVFISAMACTDGKEIKSGIFGENLEESVLWVLSQRERYFEKNRATGK